MNIMEPGAGEKTLQIFSFHNHGTKIIDVTSGQIGAQQPVSVKLNNGVWVRPDFFEF